MTQDRPPFTTTFRDRQGRLRWRFRYRGRATNLPGAPGEPAFEAAYEAALAAKGRRLAPEPMRRDQAVPRSLRAAWQGVLRSAEWRQLAPVSQGNQRRVAERFLAAPVAPGATLSWGEARLADLKRRHVKAIVAAMADRPHAAGHVLRLLRKLVAFGLDQEWIEVDPTHRMSWRPELVGHRAWSDAELAAFEARWPIGSTPRLVFTLALCTGARRADLVRLRWADLREGGRAIGFVQRKTGVPVALDVLGPLAEVLAAAPRRGATIVVTEYGAPFSDKSLTGRFRDWTTAAGLSGCTLHGLRKTLAVVLADGQATAHQIRSVLGHTTLQQAELYTREADRVRAARAAFQVINGRLKG